MGQSKTSSQGGIDDNLRKVFQSTLDEDIPDRFKDLLQQLQEQDGASAGGRGNQEDAQ